MIQFWISKPNLCQRHFLKLKSLQHPLKRNFSVRSVTKPLLASKTKVCIGVITFSTCAGYAYTTEYKSIANIIPTALSESIKQDKVQEKSLIDTNENNDIKHQESKEKSTHSTSPPKSQFTFAILWKNLQNDLHLLGIAVLSALAVAALNIQIPQLLGQIVNVVARNFASTISTEQGSERSREIVDFLSEIKEPAVRMVKLYLAQAVMTATYIYSLSCVGERLALKMREDLFASILRQDIAFYDSHKSGEIMSRLTSDIQEFKSSFKQVISMGLRAMAQTIGSTMSLYIISPEMTGTTLLLLPVIIGAGTFLGSFLRSMSKEAQQQTANASGVADECVGNIRTVRAFAMEEGEMELYSEELNKARLLNEKLGFGIGLFQGGVNLFLNGIVLGTLYYGGYLLSNQRVTPGDLMSFLVATQTIQRSLQQMSLLFGQIIKGMAAGSRVHEYTSMEPSIPLKGGRIIPYHSLFGDIEFHNVGFEYPTRPDQKILNNFNLRIPAGQMVALVGSSGGGKSTIAALIERFYDANSGKITIDGINVRDLDPSWLRGRAIGYISQEPVLFATSIMENIRFGRPSATDQEVLEAAKSANAHKFISGFPSGYDTVLGERGVTLSGGQKQRIAIARAIVKEPSILILDEATSALDSESEKIVQDALDTACKGKTVLVIAHRLSTIRHANMIAVVAGGKIAEMGTHDELKSKRDGLYSFLIKQQEKH